MMDIGDESKKEGEESGNVLKVGQVNRSDMPLLDRPWFHSSSSFHIYWLLALQNSGMHSSISF